MIKKGKKGLSTIIVTLIIIVISLVAVGIVWVVVQNVLKSGSEGVGFGKFTVSLDIVNAYEQAGNISINVKRNSGQGELTQIKFILSDGTNSETITQNTNLGELDDKTFFIHPTEIAASNVASVSIAPVIKSVEGADTVGDVADTYNIISGGTAPEEETGNGACTSVCSGNGIQYQCGDNGCGVPCGTCPAEKPDCKNHVCVVATGCPEPPSADTCGDWVCGTRPSACGNLVSCDTGVCQGKLCDPNTGTCAAVTPVNSGTVGDTWISGMYFTSPDLPKDMTGLVGNWISFSGGSAETKCWMIAKWELPVKTPPEYPYSHIGFSWTTQIKTGDAYNIWSDSDRCQANLSLS